MIISGKLTKGLGEAKKMGFPTINILPKKLPRNFKMGVYAVRILDSKKKLAGALYYGPRFQHKNSQVFEVHVLGSQNKISTKKIKIEVLKRLRGVKKFSSKTQAKKCIAADIKKSYNFLHAFS